MSSPNPNKRFSVELRGLGSSKAESTPPRVMRQTTFPPTSAKMKRQSLAPSLAPSAAPSISESEYLPRINRASRFSIDVRGLYPSSVWRGGEPGSARSSVTMLDPAEVESEIAHVERALDTYAGSDPPMATIEKTQPPPGEQVDPNIVTWDGPDDPKNPKNWSTGYRYFLSMVACVTTLNVGFASSAPTSAAPYIAAHFGVSLEITDLVTSVFLIGFIAGPIIWGPGSELMGRQIVFRVSMVIYTLFILGQALAPNISTLLITRFVSGVFAAAPLTNCTGVLVDIWDPARRGHAVAIFAACVFIGPVCGPIVGGFVASSHLGWRWVFWIIAMMSSVVTVAVAIGMPETYAPVLLQRKARALRAADPVANAELYGEHERQDWTPKGVLQRTLYRPFTMLRREPILVLTTVYLSFVYGLLYALFQAVPIVFAEERGFGDGQTGMTFIAIGVGACVGAIGSFRFSVRYAGLIGKWHGFPPPEERLMGAMIAGPALVVGSFWFGWAGNNPHLHWIVPCIGLAWIGFSVSLIFVSLLAYLVDTYLMYSASALAANVIFRSAVGAAFPLFTVQMFRALGVGWACTLVGLVALLLTPCPFLFYKFGPRIRAGSTFAPCIDLMIAKKMADARQQAMVEAAIAAGKNKDADADSVMKPRSLNDERV
ncbi:hypothetical protein HWV62_27375 [Athelia sp. TMB]|nr:hypothetical protein HWV62_27375 [Athelia sp. TMB]